MSIRRVTCPGCGAAANVPSAMANVKCPACGTVWNVKDPSAAKKSSASKSAANQGKANKSDQKRSAKKSSGDSTSNAAVIAGLMGGAMFLFAIVGMLVLILNRPPAPSSTANTQAEQTIKPATPEPYRVVDLPEEARKRIYNDYRQLARTSIEKPLALPQGGKARQVLEGTLQQVFDRELTHFAALHDITVDDVKEVIKEGDAKVWDDSPRSNAVRDGKRVYSKEMSEGWKKNPNRK